MALLYPCMWSVAVAITIIYYFYCKNRGIPFGEGQWLNFWKAYIYVYLFIGVVVCIWFTIGGLLDIRFLFRKLAKMKRSDLDDGRVAGHHNLVDEDVFGNILGNDRE